MEAEVACGRMLRRAAPLMAALVLAGCGASNGSDTKLGGGQNASDPTGVHRSRPQVVEPTAGVQAQAVTPDTPLGDPNAHAPPLSEVRQLLKEELVYAVPNTAGYIDPLQYVNHWERTDQGVDANLPVGAPILAPGLPA